MRDQQCKLQFLPMRGRGRTGHKEPQGSQGPQGATRARGWSRDRRRPRPRLELAQRPRRGWWCIRVLKLLMQVATGTEKGQRTLSTPDWRTSKGAARRLWMKGNQGSQYPYLGSEPGRRGHVRPSETDGSCWPASGDCSAQDLQRRRLGARVIDIIANLRLQLYAELGPAGPGEGVCRQA